MRILFLMLAASLSLASCGEHTAKGAGEGAAVGAASGAVGGLVSALVFGGDPAQAAARGAVYGGAVGATSGAIAGSQVDSKVEQQRKVQEEKIREKIGDDAFKGLSALLTCDHEDALQDAEKAKQSANPNYSVSGYWLELLSYADLGNNEKMTSLIPGVVEKDWDVNSDKEVKMNLLQLQDKLMSIREDYKLPKSCE